MTTYCVVHLAFAVFTLPLSYWLTDPNQTVSKIIAGSADRAPTNPIGLSVGFFCDPSGSVDASEF